jgi:hypothetical protein
MSELDEFLGAETPPAPQPPAIAKVRYTHDAMINLLIARQGRISQNDLAEHFGYTASWISQIMSSDAFQARFAERTKELVDPAIRDEAQAGFREVLARSQELLISKLAKPQVSDQLVIRSLEVAGRALGYGAREQTIINNTTNVEQHLEVLGERLVGLLHRKKSETFNHIDLLTQETSSV